jgi:histidinol-phosphate aminotransferase
MLKTPKHISSIIPYVPGKPVEELERELGICNSIKLASNENPIGPSPRAVGVLQKGLDDLNRYPDGSCFYLRNALARKLRIRQDQLIFGNGSNEIIELAVRTFLSPGDQAIMAHPSFVVYSTIVQAAKGKSVIVPLKNQRHDLKKMATEITGRTKLIFIANPNNPTGTINTQAEMDSFMKKVPEGVLVVVDEAYYEYVSSRNYGRSIKFLKKGRDILVLRTFSKIYGLAGLRIGYGISNAGIVTEMNKVRQPFNVNSLAQSAALAALEDKGHLEKTKKTNNKGKQFLYKELSKLNIDYIPTEANFIYAELGSTSSALLYKALLKAGVIVRPAGPNAVRITIGTPGENRKLVQTLNRFRKSL